MTRARDLANLIGSGNYSSTTFTATAGQTAFTISHTQGFIQVFMNGLLLDETVDYTSNGSAVTLTSGAAAGDEIEVVKYNTFSVGDALNQAAADTRYVNVTGDTITGDLGIGGTATDANWATATYGNREVAIDGGGGYGVLHLRGDGSGSTNTRFSMGVGDSTFYMAYDDVANVHRMNVSSSGAVTLNSQPQFVLQGDYNGWTILNQSGSWLPFTGSTGVATSTNNEIAMNWRSNNYGGYNPTGNGLNTSTGVFTAPVTGTYMFTFQSYVLKNSSSSGDYYHINSYINGNNQYDYTIYGYGLGSSTYSAPEITKVVRLSANDTFAFRIYLNQSPSFWMFIHYTCYTGYLLG